MFSKVNPASDSSFLPEDYLAQKAERRTNLIAIILFSVVITGIVGAFLVTHRRWKDVRHYQEAINVRYSQAAKDIEQLKELEKQKTELLQKAELTTALIEKVPRSILLAELINRMPEQVTLLELELLSKRSVKPLSAAARKAAESKKDSSSGSIASRSSKSTKAATEKDAAEVPVAPTFETGIAMVGVAPNHSIVAQYVAQLQSCELLTGVELKFSDKTIIKEREMYKFRIETRIRPDADARNIEPQRNPRLNTAKLDSLMDPDAERPLADVPVGKGGK